MRRCRLPLTMIVPMPGLTKTVPNLGKPSECSCPSTPPPDKPGVALSDEERVVSCRLWYSRVNHTAELMPAVAQSWTTMGYRRMNWKPWRWPWVPVRSALRVGLSVAKGLVAANGLPLIGRENLDLEALPYLETGVAVCAMLDAGRGEVATARFDSRGIADGEETICSPDELLESISEPTQFCGEGVVPWVSLIKERFGPQGAGHGFAVAGSPLWSLSSIARQRLAAGKTDDPAALEPNYLRMPSIGGPSRGTAGARSLTGGGIIWT